MRMKGAGQGAAVSPGPPPPLEWKFSQVFGERTAGEEIQEVDIISAIEFDKTGDHLATGDRGGRVVLFERTDAKSRDGDRRELEKLDNSSSKHPEFHYKTEFQSHEPEFDYLKSLEIEEKINKIRWCQMSNGALFLLSTNDKTIKFWKVQEKKIKKAFEFNVEPSKKLGSCPASAVLPVSTRSCLPNGVSNSQNSSCFSSDFSFPTGGIPSLRLPKVTCQESSLVARCRRVYAHAHDYHINSISNNSDGETFISADDLRINLWNLEISNQSFNIVDVKPSNMEDLTGSHEGHPNTDHIEICENHELECGSRREQIKMTKGFVAKEPVKGHMVNVVKGLKMYENIFKKDELTRMNDYVYKLGTAGQNGELSGETYVLFNKQIKGNKREQIHLGYPIFGTPKDDATSEQHQKTNNIEPIPELLHSIVDHLVQWQIIPESRKPNGCIINYFDEGESSQPYLKPPHVDQPICILLLSETTLAFGRTLVNNGEGNIKGHLMLSVKEGSVLVMRNNSADMARHVMCPSETKRVSLTFFRIRPDADRNSHYIRGHNYNHNRSQATMLSPVTQAMTVWQPGMPPSPCSNNMIPNGFGPMNLMVPKYGMVGGGPMLMLAAPMNFERPAGMNNNKRMTRGGTGVFLPWAKGGSRKPTKHLPPRAQRSRLLALPPPSSTNVVEEPHHQVMETMSDPGSEMKEM